MICTVSLQICDFFLVLIRLPLDIPDACRWPHQCTGILVNSLSITVSAQTKLSALTCSSSTVLSIDHSDFITRCFYGWVIRCGMCCYIEKASLLSIMLIKSDNNFRHLNSFHRHGMTCCSARVKCFLSECLFSFIIG